MPTKELRSVGLISMSPCLHTATLTTSKMFAEVETPDVCRRARMAGMKPKWKSNLGAWRSYARMTQDQLAAALNPPSSKGTISLYESGQRAPSMKRLSAMAEVLKTTPSAILESLPGEAEATPQEPLQPWLPSEETLAYLIEVVSHAVPEGRAHPSDFRLFAHVWRAGLEYFAANTTREHDDGYRAGVVPTVARALRDYKPRPEQAA